MADPGMRKASDSLCLQPSPVPRQFHHLAPSGMSQSVWHDVVDVLSSHARTLVDEIWMIGEVRGRLQVAARGNLAEDSKEFEPVRCQPDLWELKWSLKRGREFRLYHAEPDGGGPDMVSLLFHRKETDGLAQDEIDARQEVQMDAAAERYAAGEVHRWGHRPGCRHCLAD